MRQIMNGILGSLKPVLYTVFIFLIVTAMFAVIGKFLSALHLPPCSVGLRGGGRHSALPGLLTTGCAATFLDSSPHRPFPLLPCSCGALYTMQANNCSTKPIPRVSSTSPLACLPCTCVCMCIFMCAHMQAGKHAYTRVCVASCVSTCWRNFLPHKNGRRAHEFVYVRSCMCMHMYQRE